MENYEKFFMVINIYNFGGFIMCPPKALLIYYIAFFLNEIDVNHATF
jgi:hypothetical protein